MVEMGDVVVEMGTDGSVTAHSFFPSFRPSLILFFSRCSTSIHFAPPGSTLYLDFFSVKGEIRKFSDFLSSSCRKGC